MRIIWGNDKNVQFYGYTENCEKSERTMLMPDIGIGSLAIYKNKMNEAVALKVRNHVISGLPVSFVKKC